jgi:hypothetical protein
LGRFRRPDDYGAIVAVNDAASIVECDYWSIGDAETFRRVHPLGLPTIVTHHESARRMGMPALVYRRDEAKPWTTFSVTVALWLAGMLGRQVVCFGCYSAAEPHYFGRNAMSNCSLERWAREAAAWADMAKQLGDRGVSVQHGID